jgi:hypothetical protein
MEKGEIATLASLNPGVVFALPEATLPQAPAAALIPADGAIHKSVWLTVVQILHAAEHVAMPLILPAGLGMIADAALSVGLDKVEQRLAGTQATWTLDQMRAEAASIKDPTT